MAAEICAFFHEPTFTISYVVHDPVTKHCAIIDPVLDYEPAIGCITHTFADRIIAFVRDRNLQVQWILETHVHADHLSSGMYLRELLGGQIAIGKHVAEVQAIFGKLFNAGADFARDGSQFDRLLNDGDTLTLGELNIEVLSTPGHTRACVTFVIGDSAFIGDTLFMPDYGTARCDFPGGDAATLYRSTRRILALPPSTRLFLCHDYLPPNRREYCWETTVAEQRRANVHARIGVTEEQFVALRTARDADLPKPRLLLPSVQINMRAGELPPAEGNGIHYLKIPLNKL